MKTEEWFEDLFRVGAELEKAKQIIPGGQWEAWCEKNLKFGHTMRQFYENCYTNRQLLLDHFRNQSSVLVPSMMAVKRFLKQIKPATQRKRGLEKCPTCGRVMTKEIIARIKKAKSRTNDGKL
jgi:hypothetical protein